MEGAEGKRPSEAFMQLCYSLTIPSTRLDYDKESKGPGVYDRADRSLTFKNCGNGSFRTDSTMPEDAIVKKLVVNGGNVWNCGEDLLSRLLLKHKDTLEEIQYVPSDTKGGSFLRPYYGTSEPNKRVKPCVFPRVTHVMLKASGVPTLLHVCRLPALDSLSVCVKDGTEMSETFWEEVFQWYPTLRKGIFVHETTLKKEFI